MIWHLSKRNSGNCAWNAGPDPNLGLIWILLWPTWIQLRRYSIDLCHKSLILLLYMVKKNFFLINLCADYLRLIRLKLGSLLSTQTYFGWCFMNVLDFFFWNSLSTPYFFANPHFTTPFFSWIGVYTFSDWIDDV